jgi:UDP-N-acetylmuramoyl-tripeptide--D-alanyl-D-alanine ligase
MESFWNTKLVAEILNTRLAHESHPIQEVTTDSRKATQGSLFVAIKGDTHDGHAFIDQAIAQGATGIVTEQKISPESLQGKKVEVYQVSSTLTAIRSLAHSYRKSFSIPFIAVVGSVGKTTTKELIASILQGKFHSILKTEGSLNGFLGIPLTLLRLNPHDEIAVIEVGIDEIGAMDQHLALVEPTHVILTANGPEHLHQLKTVEIAASEELKAFDYGVAHRSAMAINVSDEYVERWMKGNANHLHKNKFFTYSLNRTDVHYQGKYLGEDSILHVKSPEWETEFHLPLPGEHHAHNLLAALTLCSFFHLTQEELKKGLATFKTAYGRTEVYALASGAKVIGDHYNSNPTSAAAALKMLRSSAVKGGKTHAVLADMLELGDHEEQFHRELASAIDEHGISQVWLYGNRMKWLSEELNQRGFKNARHFPTHDALTTALMSSIEKNDVVLIKGSRGMKMETVLKSVLGPSMTGSAN